MQEILENMADTFDDFCRQAQDLIDKLKEQEQEQEQEREQGE